MRKLRYRRPPAPAAKDMCYKKVAYDTKAKADAAIIMTRTNTKLRSYNCNFCFCWHLTSKPLEIR